MFKPGLRPQWRLPLRCVTLWDISMIPKPDCVVYLLILLKETSTSNDKHRIRGETTVRVHSAMIDNTISNRKVLRFKPSSPHKPPRSGPEAPK